jgi:xylulose-5-phosphate/fructose-6-phosphate phosphoketolase
MIVLNSPKGWTGPKWSTACSRGHLPRAPGAALRPGTHPEHLAARRLDEELPARGAVRRQGPLKPELAELAPKGERRMGANPHANGGMLLRDLRMPDFPRLRGRRAVAGSDGRRHARAGQVPARRDRSSTTSSAISASSAPTRRSRTAGSVFRVTNRNGTPRPCRTTNSSPRRPRDGDAQRAPVRGLAGGLPAHRPARLFNCYEAFIHIVDSMFNQHAKWLKVTSHLPWRRKIASLNYLLASHVWRQDHNGFTHQDPGFIDHVVNKKAESCASTCRRTPTACCR